MEMHFAVLPVTFYLILLWPHILARNLFIWSVFVSDDILWIPQNDNRANQPTESERKKGEQKLAFDKMWLLFCIVMKLIQMQIEFSNVFGRSFGFVGS